MYVSYSLICICHLRCGTSISSSDEVSGHRNILVRSYNTVCNKERFNDRTGRNVYTDPNFCAQ